MTNTLVNPTKAQIRARVRFFIDEPVQANFTNTDLDWAINQAQQEVATEISLVDEQYFVDTTQTVITTVSNQRFYPLATDFWKMTRIEDVTTGIILKFSQFADKDNFYANTIPALVSPNTAGYGVSLVGNSLALTPTPATGGTQIQYWYVPVLKDMVDDTDTTQIPRAFIDLLAMQAAIDAMIKDEDDTSPLQVRYNARFNQLVRGTRDRQQQNPRGVTRTFNSNSWTM